MIQYVCESMLKLGENHGLDVSFSFMFVRSGQKAGRGLCDEEVRTIALKQCSCFGN